MTDTFPCPACGAPNEPEAGLFQIPCAYCGTKLNIPISLQREAPPKVESVPEQPVFSPEEAGDLLRKAQPVATKAWNAFAYWSWIRRILPGCLVIIVIGICLCVILGVWPFFSQMFR